VASSPSDLQRVVDSQLLWYHTMELAPGVVTPGWFDLRSCVDGLPWPDIKGKRCLDVGTYDGFLAFEMERRGAAEVVAVDIPDHADWDWPPFVRAKGTEHMAEIAGPEKGRGFRIAADALGSSVAKVEANVYGLSPEKLGRFDVVVCGSLLLHLRDPLRALEAIRGVCSGWFMSVEQVSLVLTVLHRRSPVAMLDGVTSDVQWWVPNSEGHRQMLRAGGFDVVDAARPYPEPFGPGHPSRSGGIGPLLVRAARRILIGGSGVPHAAVLARPGV
jgi:SAM-dependent methyltransferase